MQRLGKQIELLRTRIGMSQGELAEQTQLSKRYVISLEQGKEVPNLEVLRRIAVTLGAEPREIFLQWDNAEDPRTGRPDQPPLLHFH